MTAIVSYLRLVTVIAALLLGYFVWQAYEGRQALVASQRQACRDTIRDRSSDILVRATQAWATQQVADDPHQPTRTRDARRTEAAVDRASVADRLTRVDARAYQELLAHASDTIRLVLRHLDRGQRLDCAVEHPAASLLP